MSNFDTLPKEECLVVEVKKGENRHKAIADEFKKLGLTINTRQLGESLAALGWGEWASHTARNGTTEFRFLKPVKKPEPQEVK